ncbi:MAG: hypothetical protein ACP5T4_03025 [Candidatus Micrarchaeia archaeon]
MATRLNEVTKESKDILDAIQDYTTALKNLNKNIYIHNIAAEEKNKWKKFVQNTLFIETMEKYEDALKLDTNKILEENPQTVLNWLSILTKEFAEPKYLKQVANFILHNDKLYITELASTLLNNLRDSVPVANPYFLQFINIYFLTLSSILQNDEAGNNKDKKANQFIDIIIEAENINQQKTKEVFASVEAKSHKLLQLARQIRPNTPEEKEALEKLKRILEEENLGKEITSIEDIELAINERIASLAEIRSDLKEAKRE